VERRLRVLIRSKRCHVTKSGVFEPAENSGPVVTAKRVDHEGGCQRTPSQERRNFAKLTGHGGMTRPYGDILVSS